MTVYFIDDDPLLLKAMTRLFLINNLNCKGFSSATAFLESIKVTYEPACIILDLRMPEMSGLELQNKLDEIMPHWPIIFLTGHSQVHIVVEAIKKGAIDFLEKPIDNHILLETINTALTRSGSLIEFYQERHKLTKRECVIADWLAFGFSSKEIAIELNLAIKTVEYHRANIKSKIDLSLFKKNLKLIS
ncbi:MULTISPECIES: response regulator transcription factor [Aliivibrio]|uniref:Response regulator transcription factor n=1 Tax=Aliivibrio finisterrensis TaxID=511998 RepID=A0A6N6RQA2_9GAMM|nr:MULTISPECIES: response regulator [Aliivibrio]KAB2823590.1 response regulator transcription factor [Aliivibrio finisterrensis]MDD9176466.1 response regulator [Aliivibrio sp. S3TY1]MDD9193544.1 response regulator [Aliivibrio sp. S2TY2]